METGSIDQVRFIRERLMVQNEALIAQGFWFVAFVMMSQGIETLGAFIDKKPFKARAQSKERFDLALKSLFPKRYAQLNKTDFLYRQLRSNLTHLAVASPFLYLESAASSNKRHLSIYNKKTVLLAEPMYKDFEQACLKVIAQLEAGELKAKILVE